MVSQSSESLRALNSVSQDRARTALSSCCGSRAWVDEMVAERPFASVDALFDAADRVWRGLPRDDKLEAFAAHPRIGERARRAEGAAAAWSASEQRGVASAARDVRAELARANEEYERRFGYIFIICATGKSADEMLSALLLRLANDPDTEIAIAAEEQRKITKLRLDKWLTAQHAD
jgi:OHCU decarboxylase